MTYKEWNAAIMLAGAAVMSGWVAYQAISNPVSEISAVAGRLLWAILLVIVFNILATIVVTILVSMVRREEFKDERADERDRAIGAKSMRNGYFALSVGAAASLLLLALGFDPTVCAYLLFGAMVLAGVADAASRLVYYRVG